MNRPRRSTRRRTPASRNLALAAIFASLASVGVAPAGERVATTLATRQVRAAQSASPRATRRIEFSTERTDDWLCRHVSAFFCTSIFPTASTTPPPATNSRSRSRG